jgi:uncharacterized LabA/DUF88 family protein
LNVPFARAPHAGKPAASSLHAPHAALLIDFDNVTMGIRSDITKELKNLLNSDIIKGKVAVQRAYADWRRYPQYVVPLAEGSVDLIFAPAYGSSKKNATDIRLSIDALELVFTRPEIGVFILLSGDSDFSSLVLKLKEYGKYVIGVGIRESASDLLVQNCDEYYSYSALTGLTREGEEGQPVSHDPWELVEAAVRQMASDGDVMRSDRLKQVLLDLDPSFDEKNLGFSKFNRFVAEAANRGVLRLQKMENGQYEIGLPVPGDAEAAASGESRRGGRGRGRRERPAPAPAEPEAPPAKPVAERRGAAEPKAPEREEASRPAREPPRRPEREEPRPARSHPDGDKLRASYDLLRRAAAELGASVERAVRDSDVKRRILDLDAEWDESTLGFGKFSRFLRQAHDAEAINLRKLENGSYELTLPGPAGVVEEEAAEEKRPRKGRERRDRRRDKEPEATKPAAPPTLEPASVQVRPPAPEPAPVTPPRPPREPLAVPELPKPSPMRTGHSIGLRRGSRGRLLSEPPPLLEGQAVGPRPRPAQAAQIEAPLEVAAVVPARLDLSALGLPVEPADIIAYISSYRGIGPRTAEAFASAVGAANVFRTLHGAPERVHDIVGARRGETLLAAWRDDVARRTAGGGNGASKDAAPAADTRGKSRRGGRRRGPRKSKSPSE